MSFKSVLSDKRIAAATPESIVDSGGKAVFGTFDKEFKNLNLMEIDKQCPYLPNWFNWFRLTQWEAVEVNFKDHLLLMGVSDMGLINTGLICFYDKKKRKTTSWRETLFKSRKQIKMNENLLDGSTCEGMGNNVKVKIVNNFERGSAVIIGEGFNKKEGFIKYELELQRVSLPCVVSIPFDKNKPLYTQKDLFKCKGYIEFNGERIESDEYATAIIDDHKGYYPRFSHYDWLTTMGRNTVDGKEQYFAFNLTRNQSINQTEYNENLIWFEGKTSRLTPVRFEHLDYNKWHVKDVYGMVDVTFDIGDRCLIRMIGGPLLDVNYHIVFGEISGFVKDEDGNKYILDGMCGFGEDKTLMY